MTDVIISGITYEDVAKVRLKSAVDRTKYEEFIPIGTTIANPYPLSVPETVIENTIGRLETTNGNHFNLTPYTGFNINLIDIFGLYGLSWASGVGERRVTSRSKVQFALNNGDTIRSVLHFSNASGASIYFGLRKTNGSALGDEIAIVSGADGVSSNKIDTSTLKNIDYTYTFSGTETNIGAIYIASTGGTTARCEFELEFYLNGTRLI